MASKTCYLSARQTTELVADGSRRATAQSRVSDVAAARTARQHGDSLQVPRVGRAINTPALPASGRVARQPATPAHRLLAVSFSTARPVSSFSSPTTSSGARSSQSSCLVSSSPCHTPAHLNARFALFEGRSWPEGPGVRTPPQPRPE